MGDLDTFVGQWGLDASSREFLEGLAPDVQTQIFETFQPKANTQNVDRLLRGFAKSVEQRLGARPPATQRVAPDDAALQMTALDSDFIIPDMNELPSSEDIENFVARWSIEHPDLDVGSIASSLSTHPPQVQRRALAEFAPKPGTRNVNGLFGSFVRSMAMGTGPGKGSAKGDSPKPLITIVGGGKGGAPAFTGPLPDKPEAVDKLIAQFADTHGLEAECVAALARQDREVIQRVLSTFSPKGSVRNIKSLFMGFLRSVSTGAGPPPAAPGGVRPPVGPGNVVWRPAQPGPAAASPRGVKRPATWQPLGGKAPGSAPGVAGDEPTVQELEDFINGHSLDEEAFEALANLEASIQRDVVTTFRPKESTQNVKNLFMSFLKSRTGGPRAMSGL